MDCSLVVTMRPGADSPAATLGQAKATILLLSMVTSTRFSGAADARTSGSGVHSGNYEWDSGIVGAGWGDR